MKKELACDIEKELANIIKKHKFVNLKSKESVNRPQGLKNNSVEMDSKVHCIILITKSNY